MENVYFKICTKCGAELGAEDKFCSKCGTSVENLKDASEDGNKYCKNCGALIKLKAEICPKCGIRQEKSIFSEKVPGASDKSRLIAAILSFFVGGFGVHRFYVGKTGTGILQIFLTLCFGIGCVWAFVDLIFILCGEFKDKDGKKLLNWQFD